ncbi:hypothetical protein Barb4_03247 [Bacteroidales bacterium Barb4]|nr:hypothetical protein Barb4_03247 [Bacteroidales bacterium Barb4]
MLPDHLIARRKIKDNVRPQHRQLCPGRNRHPQVLANLYPYRYTLCRKQQQAAQRIRPLSYPYHLVPQLCPGTKPAFLLKLPAVRHVHFWHHTQYLPFLKGDSGIDQLVLRCQRNACYGKHIQLLRRLHQLQQCRLRIPQQRLLCKQVHARVSRHRQLREDHHLHSLRIGKAHQPFHLPHVMETIRHLHMGDGGSHFHKSVVHCFFRS